MSAQPRLVDTDALPGPSARSITKLLQIKYQAPEWATWAEVRAGTGFKRMMRHNPEQRLDFLAFNTLPMNKFLSAAFEIKVTRADFMRELQQPGKREFAESIAVECYFVTPTNLLRWDEVPEGWGLMEATRGGLRTMKAARQRSIEPWPWQFVASLLRQEKSEPESKTLWCYAGQTVPMETLLKIADEVRGTSLAQERSGIAQAAIDEMQQGHRYQQMESFTRLLRDAMGYRYGWPAEEDVKDWLRGHGGAGRDSKMALARVESALAELKRALESEQLDEAAS